MKQSQISSECQIRFEIDSHSIIATITSKRSTKTQMNGLFTIKALVYTVSPTIGSIHLKSKQACEQTK